MGVVGWQPIRKTNNWSCVCGGQREGCILRVMRRGAHSALAVAQRRGGEVHDSYKEWRAREKTKTTYCGVGEKECWKGSRKEKRV